MEQNIEQAQAGQDAGAGSDGFQLDTFVIPCGVDLKVFLADIVDSLSVPYFYDGFTVFCNGHIAVRVKDDFGVTADPPFDQWKKINWKLANGKWVKDIPAVDLKMVRCSECAGMGSIVFCSDCDGTGEVELEVGLHSYSAECKECNGHGNRPGGDHICIECGGDGKYPENSFEPIIIPGVGPHFSVGILALLNRLHGLEIYSTPIGAGMYYFRFDGGDGVVMARSE